MMVQMKLLSERYAEAINEKYKVEETDLWFATLLTLLASVSENIPSL